VKTLQPKIVVDGLIYPEGIRWSQDRVWFSDVLDLKVYTYDPMTRRTAVVVQTEDLPSGLGFLPDGRLLIATMRERKLLRLEADGLKVVADLKPLCEMLNDMVVDAQGRAYLDSHFSVAADGGGIIMVEPSGDCRIVADNMKAPNGLAVTADGRTLIANDLLANRLVAFDITPDGREARGSVYLFKVSFVGSRRVEKSPTRSPMRTSGGSLLSSAAPTGRLYSSAPLRWRSRICQGC
jgi:sugar lactone lactonase YvrE